MADRGHVLLIFLLSAVPGAIYLWMDGLVTSPRWWLILVCASTGIALIYASVGLQDTPSAEAKTVTAAAGWLLLVTSLIASAL